MSQRRKIRVTNDFHNTWAYFYLSHNRLTQRTANRVRKILCGCSECICGQGTFGTRGRQDCEHGPDPVVLHEICIT